MVVAHRPRCADGTRLGMRALGRPLRPGTATDQRAGTSPATSGSAAICRAPSSRPWGSRRRTCSIPGRCRGRALLGALIRRARASRRGRAYTLAVPRREARLRLACAWPLIGLGTLARLRRAENLLDPAVTVKVPRAEVRRISPAPWRWCGPTAVWGLDPPAGRRRGRPLTRVYGGGRSAGTESARSASGSTRAPPRSAPKWRWAPVTRPVAPTAPITWPVATASLTATRVSERW